MTRIRDARAKQYPAYTGADMDELARRYSPAQVAAIRAGEAAIDPQHLADQARIRSDVFTPKYVDDYARIQPGTDMSIQRLRGEGAQYAEVAARDPSWRDAPDPDKAFKSIMREVLDPERPIWDDDNPDRQGMPRYPAPFDDSPATPQMEALLKDSAILGESGGLQRDDFNQLDLATGGPKKHSIDLEQVDESEREAFHNYLRSHPAMQERHKSERTPLERLAATMYDPTPSPDVAPAVPMIHDPTVRWDDATKLDPRATDDETALAYVGLARTLGQSVSQIRNYRVKNLVSHRVVNQTRLGKVQSIYILSVAGNEDGLLGIGEGKSTEPEEAARQSRLHAIRNMVPVRRYENRTVFGELRGKVGGVEICLRAKPPGYGLRCSSHIHEMMRCAGITDLASKVTRGRNPMNVCKAVWEAIKAQKDPEDVARGRGKKMVDVRKVYYAGLV